MATPDIQLWSMRDQDRRSEPFAWRVEGSIPQPGEELQARINAAWQQATEKNPKMQDNPVLFLDAIQHGDGLEVKSREGPFSVTYFFNRTDEGHGEVEALDTMRGLTSSTHMVLSTTDGRVMYAFKSNQSQVSGFGGFPQGGTDFPAEGGYVSVDTLVPNRLRKEIGEKATDAIVSIEPLGVTYVDRPGLRGTDVNFHVVIGESADWVRRQFPASDQFDKKFWEADLSPDGLVDTIERVHAEGRQMSPYAMGCAAQVANTLEGKAASERVMEAVRSHGGVEIATGNHTRYLGGR